jgi:hypothetical protein
VRPRLAEDGDPSVPDVVEVSGKEITLREKTSSAESFAFDRVFGPSVSNEELFDSSIKAVVDQVARGLSSCVFTYGQTGACVADVAARSRAKPAGSNGCQAHAFLHFP